MANRKLYRLEKESDGSAVAVYRTDQNLGLLGYVFKDGRIRQEYYRASRPIPAYIVDQAVAAMHAGQFELERGYTLGGIPCVLGDPNKPGLTQINGKRVFDRCMVESLIKNAGLSLYQFTDCVAALSSCAAPAYCKKLYFWALYRAFFNEFLTIGYFCEYVQNASSSLATIPTRTAIFYALAIGRDFEQQFIKDQN